MNHFINVHDRRIACGVRWWWRRQHRARARAHSDGRGDTRRGAQPHDRRHHPRRDGARDWLHRRHGGGGALLRSRRHHHRRHQSVYRRCEQQHGAQDRDRDWRRHHPRRDGARDWLHRRHGWGRAFLQPLRHHHRRHQSVCGRYDQQHGAQDRDRERSRHHPRRVGNLDWFHRRHGDGGAL